MNQLAKYKNTPLEFHECIHDIKPLVNNLNQ